jgi:hypothetical protein
VTSPEYLPSFIFGVLPFFLCDKITTKRRYARRRCVSKINIDLMPEPEKRRSPCLNMMTTERPLQQQQKSRKFMEPCGFFDAASATEISCGT